LRSNPLAVPKIVCSLITSHNFDRYANSHSLFPPLAAVVFLARAFVARVRVLTASQNKKDTQLGGFFVWRRRRDSNLQSKPLAVPKIVCSLFTSHNFDRYAYEHSLFPPQEAVVFIAQSRKPAL
jgi:hypothetical protein